MAKLKKRKDGRYPKQVYIGKTPTGEMDGQGKPKYKRDYITVYGRTIKEVEEKAAKLKIQKGKGIDITVLNDSFAAWGERYISRQKAKGYSDSYINCIEINLAHLSAIQTITLNKINIADIQEVIDFLAGWHNGKPPMAYRSLKGVRQTAGAVFKYAIASRAAEYNPAEYVVLPKTATVKKVVPITLEQRDWIVNTPHRAQRAAMIMVFCGLRRGEVLALTKKDIDFKQNIIHVRRDVVFNKNGVATLSDTTKTEAGERAVDMPTVLSEFLYEDLKKDDCMYLVAKKDGSLMSKSAWDRMWESYMQTLNLKYGYTEEEKQKENINSAFHPRKLAMRIPTFTAHQLRHRYCTDLYLAGVDIKVMQKKMGHKSLAVTMEVYTHLEKMFESSDMEKYNESVCKSYASQASNK